MRTKKGTVTSAKLDKTVTVTVSRLVMHPKYRKRYPVSKKFLADTDGKEVKEGDQVIIGEIRPLSKRKRFKVLEVVGSSEVVGMTVEEELQGIGDKGKGKEGGNQMKSNQSEEESKQVEVTS